MSASSHAGTESGAAGDLTETILVTGGCGFIGANFVRDWMRTVGTPVVNLDKLTYAGHLESLIEVASSPGYTFVHGEIGDRALVDSLLRQHRPRAIVHLAAETHVDRSIDGPEVFVETNLRGTFVLLEAARAWIETIPRAARAGFRFLHVSTDEVYGSLAAGAAPFREDSPYAPNSPYAASKAAADHLVRAYLHTYGLPAIVTNCSNNYGPYQMPEKLIPLMISFALAGRALPVYGDGLQVRDWLYVEDHCAALRLVLAEGRVGEVYNIGGAGAGIGMATGMATGITTGITNLALVQMLCHLLDELAPAAAGRLGRFGQLIRFVEDRPGHDRRYAIDASKIRGELGWRPRESLAAGLRKTVTWYLSHGEWVRDVSAGEHTGWIASHYGSS